MARFLVVEDDAFFREAIRVFLEGKNHQVSEAPNGKVARDILGATKFDAIVSDVEMPYLTGVELLEWVTKNCPTPFILMTGFSNLLDAERAHRLGAQEFLPKPFRNEDLVAAVERILQPIRPHQNNDAAEAVSFCKVSIDEFVARPKIDFDVYVRLTEKKYIKIGYAGNELPREQIANYKNKGLKHLHIKKEDFHKLVAFNLELGQLLKNNDEVPKEKKMNFMKYTGEVLLEKVFVDDVDQESFEEAREFMGMTVSAIINGGEYFDLLSLLNDHSDHIYAHSVGVSMYAIMLARKMGFESQKVFFTLSMAGLFHDIGKKEVDRDLLQKSRPLLSQNERRMVETHATRGKEILLAVKGIPADVIQLVYEHHEDCAGQGYPRGIGKHDMHPLSKILQLANLFVEQALRGPHNTGKPAKAAIDYIGSIYMDRVDAAALKALRELFPKAHQSSANRDRASG